MHEFVISFVDQSIIPISLQLVVGATRLGKSCVTAHLLSGMHSLMRWDLGIVMCPRNTYLNTPHYLQLFPEGASQLFFLEDWAGRLGELMGLVQNVCEMIGNGGGSTVVLCDGTRAHGAPASLSTSTVLSPCAPISRPTLNPPPTCHPPSVPDCQSEIKDGHLKLDYLLDNGAKSGITMVTILQEHPNHHRKNLRDQCRTKILLGPGAWDDEFKNKTSAWHPGDAAKELLVKSPTYTAGVIDRATGSPVAYQLRAPEQVNIQSINLNSYFLAGMVSLNGGDEEEDGEDYGGDDDEEGEDYGGDDDDDDDGEDDDDDGEVHGLEPCATCGAESTETHYGVDYCYDHLPGDDNGDHGADFGELEHLLTPPAFDPVVVERFRNLGGELQ